MPLVTVEKDFIYLALPATDSNKLGGHWTGKDRGWRFPNNLVCLKELNRFYPCPELATEEARKSVLTSNVKILKTMPDAPGNQALRPYQRVDVQLLKKLPHAGIFSEMRTGKTPTALHVVETPFNIVVCPASLLLNWKKEIHKWLPNSTVYVSKGTPKKREKLYVELNALTQYPESPMSAISFLVISYETLKKDLNLLVEFLRPLKRNKVHLGTLLVDEAHRLNNHTTDISLATNKLGKYAQKRIAITGTPAKDDGSEVYGILSFLYPSKFPSYWAFLERYWHTVESRFSQYQKSEAGIKRQKELLEIIQLMSVNRRRKEVMAWLPAKEYITVELEMDSKQANAYKEVLDTFLYEEDNELKVDAPSILAQITRLRQITLAPELLDIKAPSVKEAYIMDWLVDNPEEQVIIFSGFTSYLKILSKKLEKHRIGMIHGEMSAVEKQRVADQFQAGKIRVILANIEAGGVGFTLDVAENVIFLDKHYNPTLNDQAEDRIIPISEDRNHSCTVTSLVCIDSIDQRVDSILQRKQDIIKVINEVGLTILK